MISRWVLHFPQARRAERKEDGRQKKSFLISLKAFLSLQCCWLMLDIIIILTIYFLNILTSSSHAGLRSSPQQQKKDSRNLKLSLPSVTVATRSEMRQWSTQSWKSCVIKRQSFRDYFLIYMKALVFKALFCRFIEKRLAPAWRGGAWREISWEKHVKTKK